MTPARVEVRHGSHFITFSQLIQVTWTDVAFNSSCKDLPGSALCTLLHAEEVGERDTRSGSGNHAAAVE